MFNDIGSNDCDFDDIVGNPKLPIYIQRVALPANSNRLLSSTIEELEWDTIIVGRIVPVQPPHLESEVAESLFINHSIYESGWYRPELVKTTGIQTFRGIRNTNVIVCPFRYDALSGKLAVLRKFNLRVWFSHDNVNRKVSDERSQYHYLFDNIDAPYETYTSSLSRNEGEYDYLIVVGDIHNVFASIILKEFQLWKSLRGIRTKVVTTATTGTSDSSIKAYIQSQYAAYNIKYVLFIGKAHHIPLHLMHQSVYPYRIMRSDYWYGCMDGDNDFDADVAIGRYPVNTLQELENAMRKTMKYEVGTNAVGEKVLLVAHQEPSLHGISFKECLESIRTDSQNSNFTFIKEYGATVANGGTGATSASVAGRINQEVGIFNYRGHAGPFFWRGDWSYQSTPLFDSLMISTFTNDKYPIALSIACETGRIDSTSAACLMELYMKGEHGISAGLGATADSWHEANNKYNQKLYSMINLENKGLGFINIGAHQMCAATPTATYKDNRFCYCCFGDPSVRVWTNSIQQFPTPTIEVTSNSLNISIGSITDYDIVVASESDGFITEYHSTSNNYSIPLPSVSCTIAIHKQNFESYLFDYIATGYVQNKTINRHTFTSATPIAIGRDVTTEVSTGNVIIEDGGILEIKQCSDVVIPNGFTCKLGGQLIIK